MLNFTNNFREGSLMENNTLEISIVIPTFNSAKTLDIPMKSISNMRKSFFKLKVLLVDSNSSDNTKKIFFSYGKELDLIFKDIGKCSIGEARNYAITKFKADYLIFLDSDDALIKDRLDFDYKLIAKYRKLNFLYGIQCK